ncbi:MAG: M23 family metallopeptidase [Bacteroidales bacterium]|jgi:murein DD-endopeptidase MepM/ murein hydrolase activator NlpD|nr:M23 family metallopeptidase [Bacteroidales bacterium]MDY0369265.1 M23 family metallopeptidase [Bacteroidales bacterium]
MKHIVAFFCVFYIFSGLVFSQQSLIKPDLHPPLEIPLYLSGTFGELRSDHFHAGVDLRTQTVEGHKVLAVDDGYVSRIAISTGGYGKALYITHPSTGLTSVYGHLQRFNKEIGEYVKAKQYALQSFQVNLFPEAARLVVKKGELIALSGNTGSSGGPHLHFEIRDTPSQQIMNPLSFGLKIKDYIRPKIVEIAVYPENDSAFILGENKRYISSVAGWGEQHRLPANEPLTVWGELSFGINTYDTHNDTPNKNGVYSIELMIDSTIVFSMAMDRFSFDETLYINSLIDYGYYIQNNTRFIRTKIDPLNKLSLYGDMPHTGSYSFMEEREYTGCYTVTDHHGNISKLPFTLVAQKPLIDTADTEVATDSTVLVQASEGYSYKEQSFSYSIPARALYKDERLTQYKIRQNTYLSDVICIGDEKIPLHKAIQLHINIPELSLPEEKLLVVSLKNDKPPVPLGVKIENGTISLKTRKFGCFAIMADTLPPQIRQKNAFQDTLTDSVTLLRFEIEDELSGIGSYRAELNDNWLLMEYDPKTKTLFYEVDERLTKGKNTFKLIVTDKQGNASVFRKTFIKL